MSSHSTRLLVSLSLLLSLLLAWPLWAAESILGTVVDPGGAAVPRAAVRLLDTGGVVVATTLSDTEGWFRFEGLATDSYTLEVELTGFAPSRQSVRAGETVEIKLELAPVRERVVVTATRTEAPTSQVGSSVTVIPAELLQNRHSATLTELLRTVPGIVPVQSGPPGAITTVFARGGESDHNKVFIDGVPVNEPGGFFNFANFTPLNLNRLEVVRGPQSALFGSDALGSTIQLFTQRGVAETPRPRARASVEGGTQETLHGATSVSGGFGRFDYSLAGARFLTDNAGSNSAFRNTTLSGNFGLGLGRRAALRTILHGDFGTVGTPGQTAFQRPDSDAFFRRRDAVASTSLQLRLRENWNQRLSYGYSRSAQRSANLFADPPYRPRFQGRVAPFDFFDFPFDFINHTRRHRFSYQSDLSFTPTQIFTAALEYEREKGRIGDFLFPPFVLAHRTNVGGVLQHQALLLGRLYLTGGVRIEDNGSFGSQATPRLSAAYFLRRLGERLGATKLKFNLGSGIKEPQFFESFSPSPFFLGNPNLEPERVRSVEAGLEQRFAHERAKLEINWFDNRFRDLIAFTFDPVTFTGTFINIGRTKARGGEVVLETAPWKGLHAIASYTYLDSQVVESIVPSDPVFGQGRPLFRRPRHSGSLVVLWDWRSLNLTSTTAFVGPRADSDFELLGLASNPGYTKWDLAVNLRPRQLGGQRLTYYVVVENLLNRRYMEVLGFPALKLTVRAGGRVEF